MENEKKIFDGDVVARVNVAIETYKSNKNVYYNNEMHNAATAVKGIAKLYKRSGWKAVAKLIEEVNKQCWTEYSLGCENVSRFYTELYHAACAWYQGYPANKYEEEHANEEDGCFDHVSAADAAKIYSYLD